tara:strand:- start:184 stop:456 length:273 start_codon:yes stop_codon:yes gene_type:complete
MKYDLKALNILSGCGLLSKKLQTNDLGEVLLFSVLVLLIKSLIVMIAYNHVIPKIIKNIYQEYQEDLFRPITVIDAFWVVLLFTNLVNYW